MQRRTFLQGAALAGAAAAPAPGRRAAVDHRYAPASWQSTFGFPDDPHKSLVGEKGDLRYGFDRRKRIYHFPHVVQFSLRGMEADRVAAQRLDAAGVPIIQTRIERPEAFLDLTTFATNRAGEGRVDNVLLEVRPKSAREVYAAPVMLVKTRGEPLPYVADCPLRRADTGDGYAYTAPESPARPDRPLRCFFRFPLEGQKVEARDPDGLLAEARRWWGAWSPLRTGWRLPGVQQDFLVACARNILQARERVDGKLTFQVGATHYRGLWVVDGNFILEAAAYLGYDEEVRQGLETTWGMQRADGSVVAAVETAHWKDTGIAMFTLVRQAELSQDWSYFRKMKPELLRAVRFLASLRQKAREEGSANGRYGLLAKGFGDGGIGGGLRDELTNTLWALAGLRAVVEAGLEEAAAVYGELREAFFTAARRQMRRHPAGFDYLPMLLKEDPEWEHADPWKRPRPQTGQWALAHGIYPGLIFEPRDAVVQGYLALMQACTREDVPVETGWLPHEGVWNYDAAFAAHAFLWAGERARARSIFTGFLNHSTPLYCWREEQPLQGALIGNYVGDMPHNWASAECILFLRHMLALEDGPSLRLLEGVDPPAPCRIENSPSRFGRVTLELEPVRGGWRLKFARGAGPAPREVRLPESLGGLPFAGSGFQRGRGAILADPASTAWEAVWRS